jgi:adenylate cyclase
MESNDSEKPGWLVDHDAVLLSSYTAQVVDGPASGHVPAGPLLGPEQRPEFPVPKNEAERLRILDDYRIVGSDPEQAFDDLAELAARICGCPVGQINIMTEKHRWTKACYGLPLSLAEVPRGASSCQWTVCQSDLVVVPDLTRDDRFRHLSYVVGPPHARFYAGMPLINPEGYALGTLCVADFEPRQLTAEQADGLRRLARQAIGQLELRRHVIALRETERTLADQKQRAESLLLSILPPTIAHELMEDQKVEPRYHPSVTILFADFKDFTSFAETMEPRAVIDDLDGYFRAFDDIIVRHGLETLKTVGDGYIAVGGLPEPNHTHLVDACLAALAIQDYVARMNVERAKLRMPHWELRVGIHTGGVMAGVVGSRRFTYDVWGDTVNVAARMESTAHPGRINISQAIWQHVRALFDAEPRGMIEAKHKGKIAMFFLTGIRPEFAAGPDGRRPNDAFVATRQRLRL